MGASVLHSQHGAGRHQRSLLIVRFAVATVMIVTSSLIAVQIYCVKKLPIAVGVAFFVVFVFFDGLFWGASLKKVPHGAWVPLMIGFVL